MINHIFLFENQNLLDVFELFLSFIYQLDFNDLLLKQTMSCVGFMTNISKDSFALMIWYKVEVVH